ncbi:chemokine-like receptor 1 [Megalops cyprinoides]|uniref:chemokine-like receptor 1 n=1 Tax=Megalops cyprinoides TaxID=118141 RepID=UPI001863AC89|nr:chemokine-like receptor 1 [Megalops cyprinoides]
MTNSSSFPRLQGQSQDSTGAFGLAEAITNTVLIIFYFLIIFLGTTGNAVVIWTAGFRLPATVTGVWLVNLAVADLVFSLSRVLSLTQRLFFDHWPFGTPLCKLNGFLKYTNMFCSVFLLSVISLDRALCVWRPLLAKQRRTQGAARLVSVGVWLLSVALSAPFSAQREAYAGRNNLTRCSMRAKDTKDGGGARYTLYTLRFLCGFLLPFLVILGCYGLAAVGLQRSRFRHRSKPLRILACLVSAFFLCWAPYHCLLLVKMVNSSSQAVKVWLPLATGLAYLNSCMNPLLYFCMGLSRRGLGRGLFVTFRRVLVEEGEAPTDTTRWQRCAEGLGAMTQATAATADSDVQMAMFRNHGETQT